MKKWHVASVIILFAILTAIYFRYTLFVGPEALVTRHLATDLYQYFITTQGHIEWLKQGFVPLGDYWVNRGGGFPAVPVEQLLVPSNLLLMATYAITGSFTVSLRILMPIFYLATLITAYWYGVTLFKRRDAGLVLAVAYTFSMYGVSQLEHIDLIGVQPFVLLTLIFLEKTLADTGKTKHVILTGIFLFLVYLTQLYPFYFTVVFIGFRLTFHLITEPRRLETIKGTAKAGTLFLLLTIPFLLPQILSIPSQEIRTMLGKNLLTLSQPPELFFLRSTADVPIPELGGPFYLGLSVVVLLLIPIILRRTNRAYIFYLLVAMFFLFYAAGRYSPLNIAGWVQGYVPLSFFLRAAGRVMIIGYLALAVCAVMGFVLLADKLKSHVPKLLLLLAIVVLILCDRTLGYEPPTMTTALRQNGAYELLREQPGDFRVMEIPSTYLQMATSSMHTKHDVLGSYTWGHGYFGPQYAFAGLYNKCLQQEITPQEAAFYGVKYIIINTDLQYYDELYQDLKYYNNPKLWQVQEVADYFSSAKDYELVYDKGGYTIYENPLYRGIVFSDEATVQYVRKDPNTLIIDTEAKSPTSIFISQGYAEGWIATMEDGRHLYPTEVNSIQKLEVPTGNHRIILHYQRYECSLINFLAFYMALAIILVGRKRELTLLIYGTGLTVFSLVVYPQMFSAAPSLYHTAIICLGTVLMLGAGLAYLRKRVWT